LSPYPDYKNPEILKVNGVALSKVGRGFFRIVDHAPMPEYTVSLRKYFERQKLQMVEIPTPNPIITTSKANE